MDDRRIARVDGNAVRSVRQHVVPRLTAVGGPVERISRSENTTPGSAGSAATVNSWGPPGPIGFHDSPPFVDRYTPESIVPAMSALS
jgi:hypothetical protein